MPRAKALKKQTEAVPSEPTDPTPNGIGNVAADQNPAAGEEAKVSTKGKPRSKKATKTTVAVEQSSEVESEQAPPAVARGKKKQQPKDTEENGEEAVVSKPKGRAKKATADADPSGKAAKARAKKDTTSAPEEEAAVSSKGRSKTEKPAAAEEPKARGRKRKESAAEANGSEEPAAPPKRRTKKEASPANQEEPVNQKAETATAKRARGTKRLADSEIAAALEEEEVDEEPPKAASKRTKKTKVVEPEPEGVGDAKPEVKEVPPKAAAKKRTKQIKDSDAADENAPKAEGKTTKSRAKKEAKEEQPAPVKKRGLKISNDKENGAEPEPSTENKPAVRGRKKAVGKVENKEEAAEPAAVSKPGRSRKKAAAEIENDEDDEEVSSKTNKTAKKGDVKSIGTLDKESFALPVEKTFNLKISSWNVAGLRAWLKKDGLQLLDLEEPDIFCLQETKCANDQLPDEVTRLPGYHPYWLCMPGGYAGVAVYSKIMPINVEYGIGNEEFDDVGRMITAEYEKFYLINVYVPNSGRKLVNLESRMRWEKLFQAYVQKLDALKPVVICGDMNVSHMPIDLQNPKANTKNAGFTQEERDKMTELLSLGFVDSFRHLYPDRKGAYTFWTYMANARARNVGWRLDYCLVSERFLPKVVEHEIRSQCMGSDHCPITVFFNI
ncbi:recombination repair protein 1 isoform X2 [Drosophila ficusphila]|uniref:recombination repair protein 1 isoform X2 n=1 Tax=Drosophila ficusphila TaxID=30025 RepID=UPI001C8AB269|nr:recombination repair protein 1 isoform X2 [Drosophila ficusphila]